MAIPVTVWSLLIVMLSSGCDIGPKHPVPVIPGAPSPTSPPNASADRPDAVYLEWEGSDVDKTYHVQLSRTEDFAELLVDERTISKRLYPVNELDIDSTYFWHVRASNEAGVSAWSATWSFTPAFPASLPEAPQLVYPPDESDDQPNTVSFRWTHANGARFYHLQASLERDFFSREADMNELTDTSQAVSALVFDYIYFWRVRGRNAAGFGPWSPTWFIVIATGG